MGSLYPTGLDTDLELPRADDDVTEIRSDILNALRSSIFAIESALGVNIQGNTSDLVTRVNSVIDDDGNIKTSALSDKGLISLPISNVQIATNASIAESKLDLNYSTSTLNSRITSANSDVDTIRDSLDTLSVGVISHYAGSTNKHDGYDIPLNTGVRSSDDVEIALHVLDIALDKHERNPYGVHTANKISISDEFVNFSASNVQEAIGNLDIISSGGQSALQSLTADNAITLNDVGESGVQGNLKETSFASTIYQTDITEATNILQVMRPNVARITSKNMDLHSLSATTAKILRIQAGGIDRTYIDIDLSSIIATDNVDAVVNKINNVLHSSTNHYPVSAYNTDERLTLAHNLPGQEFTMSIVSGASNSAATALGFGDIVDTVFDWAGANNAVFIAGQQINDFRSTNISYVHSGALNTISPEFGSLIDLGIQTDNTGRILFNVTNHSVDSTVNGTYYITSFPSGASFTVNTDIFAGTFDLEIAYNSINFANSANGELYDIFVSERDGYDGYSDISAHNRVTYGVISGIDIRTVSKDFPTSGVTWAVNSSNQLSLATDSVSGVKVDIPTGYVGQLKVFSADNVSSALFEVTGSPSVSTRSITASTFAGSNTKFYLGSVHYAGNHGINTLKYATDKRLFGGVPENTSGDKLTMTRFEDSLNELRNNGIIRGFDVMANTNSTIKIRGGKALVNGRIIEAPTKTITVDLFGAADRIILLDKGGKFVIKSELDGGYAFSDLIEEDAYGDNRGVATIAEFTTDGTIIESGSIKDRRLMIGNIDKRLLNKEIELKNRIANIQGGMQWGITVASSDGYMSEINPGENTNLEYIPSGTGIDNSPTDAIGFLGGDSSITTRVFGLDAGVQATNIFKASGLSHINIFVEFVYTGESGGPFGTSGAAHIEIGAAVVLGTATNTTVHTSNQAFVRVKSISSQVLPSSSVTERYVVSVPTTHLSLENNTIFDLLPRIRFVNSNYIDGGGGADPDPLLQINFVRIVTSSYSVAGEISSEDGSDSAIYTAVSNIL